MEFRTKIELEKMPIQINYHSKLILFGSCFAENIGSKLLQSNFEANVNPFGVLYNPSSIAQALNLILDQKIFEETELFRHQGFYHSYFHHSSFSDRDKQKCLQNIQSALDKALNDLCRANVLMITFGTAHIFRLRETGAVVANCHKQPDSVFERSRLSVDEIVADWNPLIVRLRVANPKLKILFTVSPIRHWKDGAHGNQLSKSILLLAIDELQKRHSDVFYFPAYELVLDELRDYRFYAADMIHPSEVAINYVWERFSQIYFDTKTLHAMNEWLRIRQALDHRPFNPESEDYQHFIELTQERLQKWMSSNKG